MLFAILPLVLLLEYGHGIARIVGELIGVAGIERLTMAEILTKLVGTRTKQNRIFPIFHRILGNVHRENHGCLLLADRSATVALFVVVVGEVWEDQPFEEGTCLARGIAEIDR